MLNRLLLIIFASLLLGSPLSKSNQAEASEAVHSCQCVAFRLDDVQDYFLSSAQMQVINTFEQRNASLTVGVIGNAFGDDPRITQFLKEKINSNSAIEVANHGWNHEDFTGFTREEQSALIKKTNEKIMHTLDVRPKVFIPPYNLLNDDTIAALLENDFLYLSANTTLLPPSRLTDSRNDADNGIMHYPSSALTGDLNDDNTKWIGYPHDATFAAVNASMNNLGYAVISMHPMEFSLRNGTMYQNEIDEKQIHELELLIDDILAAGYRIVTISQINDPSIVVPEFSSYHIAAILIASIMATIWFSNKRGLNILK